MGRPRKNPADNRLPPNVYRAKGRFVYRACEAGKLGPEIILGREDAPLSDVWRAYESLKRDGQPRRTLAWLLEQFNASPAFLRLAPRTQKDYTGYGRRIGAAKLRNGQVFGEVELASITRGAMQKYHDRRAQDAPIQANRELAYLSCAFEWAANRDITKANPCKGVERAPEKPKTIYVTDDAYATVLAFAGQEYAYLPPIMELAYLCRMRLSEVLDLQRADVLPAGLHVRRRKGSRDNITAWTPRLRAAVDAALALPRKITPINLHLDHIIPARSGGRLRETTVQTAWDRMIKRALAAGLQQRFSLHDLKAKGVTDTDGDKQAASGHKSAQMVAVYDRKPPIVPPAKS